MNSKEAAKYLGISDSYLYSLRYNNFNHHGPKYTKKKLPKGKGCIRTYCDYSKEDLDNWKKYHDGVIKGRIKKRVVIDGVTYVEERKNYAKKNQ